MAFNFPRDLNQTLMTLLLQDINSSRAACHVLDMFCGRRIVIPGCFLCLNARAWFSASLKANKVKLQPPFYIAVAYIIKKGRQNENDHFQVYRSPSIKQKMQKGRNKALLACGPRRRN